MQRESIEIRTTKERFFNEYLILKRPIIDSVLTKINKKRTTLSDVPLKVLAQLLYFNDKYRELDNEDKWDKVFSRDSRDEIQSNLRLKEHHLNNYISSLRKMKILDGKKIRDHFIVYADENHELSFKFHVNGQT